MLQAQLIRDTTRQVLTNATDAGSRVYGSPILPIRRERPLPCLSVYTLRDSMQPLGESGPYQLRHHLDVTIECVAELPTDPSQTADDRLMLDACQPVDDLVDQVQNALYPNPLWYNALQLSPIHGIEKRTEFANIIDSDRRTGAAILTITVVYDEIFEPNPADFLYVCAFGDAPPAGNPPFGVDMISPFNPNLAAIGPDGQIDVNFRVPPTGNLWNNASLWIVGHRSPADRELRSLVPSRARHPPDPLQ